MSFCRLDQDLADLNGKFRFVDITMSDPSWSEIDEDHNETSHRSIDIRLSHVGACDEDKWGTYDDTTVAEAVHDMWTTHVTSANDYSRMGVVHQDDTHDYQEIMEYIQDGRNWFKRARGEWRDDDPDYRCRWCGRSDARHVAGFHRWGTDDNTTHNPVDQLGQ